MAQHKRLSNVDQVRIINVIEVRSIIGKGTIDDIVHAIYEYYSLDGVLLARTKSGEDLTPHEWHGHIA